MRRRCCAWPMLTRPRRTGTSAGLRSRDGIERASGGRQPPERVALLLDDLLQGLLNGVGPDLVTLRRQVQEVRHDLLGEGAVLLQELLADVQVPDVLAVIQL